MRHPLQTGRSLLLIDHESHEVDVRFNGADSERTVFFSGQEIPVTIEDYNLAQLRKTAGMATGQVIDTLLKAPMPGLIVAVKVRPGDKVENGQPLVAIEAMKMENILKASLAGTVKAINIEAGQSVEKGDKLIEFE